MEAHIRKSLIKPFPSSNPNQRDLPVLNQLELNQILVDPEQPDPNCPQNGFKHILQRLQPDPNQSPLGLNYSQVDLNYRQLGLNQFQRRFDPDPDPNSDPFYTILSPSKFKNRVKQGSLNLYSSK